MIIHDWPMAEAVSILKNIVSIARPSHRKVVEREVSGSEEVAADGRSSVLVKA